MNDQDKLAEGLDAMQRLTCTEPSGLTVDCCSVLAEAAAALREQQRLIAELVAALADIEQTATRELLRNANGTWKTTATVQAHSILSIARVAIAKAADV